MIDIAFIFFIVAATVVCSFIAGAVSAAKAIYLLQRISDTDKAQTQDIKDNTMMYIKQDNVVGLARAKQAKSEK